MPDNPQQNHDLRTTGDGIAARRESRPEPASGSNSSPGSGMSETMTYDMLAVDLDGTLVDRRGCVSSANREALRQADQLGVRIVVCTGRGLAECREIIRPLGLRSPVAIVAGGAMTVDADSGRTISRFQMPAQLVQNVSALLNERTGHHVLLLKDRWKTGVDYVLRGKGTLDQASQWWFRQVPVHVYHAPQWDADPWPDDTVRLGIVTTAREMKQLSSEVAAQFGNQTFLHHFPVISMDGNGRHLGEDAIHLMEVFSSDTNKWTALRLLAEHHAIPVQRIAAIGDEINDVDLIRHAGLGIAMGNAIAPVRQIADQVTKSIEEDGVAYAIHRILTGEW